MLNQGLRHIAEHHLTMLYVRFSFRPDMMAHFSPLRDPDTDKGLVLALLQSEVQKGSSRRFKSSYSQVANSRHSYRAQDS